MQINMSHKELHSDETVKNYFLLITPPAELKSFKGLEQSSRNYAGYSLYIISSNCHMFIF